MSPEEAVKERLPVVLRAAALNPVDEPRLILSHSNDTWVLEDSTLGAVVLRVCWIGDRDRMLREAAVGAALPPEVPYPEVLRFGRVAGKADLTWAVTARLPGRSLADAWPDLTPAQQRAACREVATAMRHLHRWRPEGALLSQLVPRALPPQPTVAEAVGRSINPLSGSLPTLLAGARRLGVDRRLLDSAEAFVGQHAHLLPTLDDPGLAGVTHGDLHLSNVWWDGERVSALLDFEWVRLAPAWVDLARMADAAESVDDPGRMGAAELLRRLPLDYPELFAVDHLHDRIRLVQVAYQVRELHLWDAPIATAPTPVDHPSVLLARLLEQG